MPVFLDFTTVEGGRLIAWHIHETTETLQLFSQTAENDPLLRISHPGTRKRKLAVKALLKVLAPDRNISLIYNNLGKPSMDGMAGYISITHCHHYAAIYYHPDKQTGIDLEEPSDRILRIVPKFINSSESEWYLHGDKQLNAYIIWGAKESSFKLIGGGGIDFKSHLQVEKPAHTSTEEGTGMLHFTKHNKSEQFRYRFLHLEDVILVYTIA